MPTFYETFSGRSNHRLEVYAGVSSQNVSANTSNVYYSIGIRRSGGYGSFSNSGASGALGVGGNVWVDSSFGYDTRNSTWILLASGTVTRAHDDDGTLTIAVRGYVVGDTIIGNADTGVIQVELPTIPRASTASFTGGASFDAGDAVTVNTNRAAAAFTHDITWSFGGLTGTVGTGVGASTSWTPPMSMLTKIPNSTSGSGSIKTVTKNGSTVIGTTTTPFTLKVPSSVTPTVSSVTVQDGNPDVQSLVGKLVQGLSRASFTINGAGVYGSTIKSTAATFQGKTVPQGSDALVTASGSLPITGKITDSRGRTGTGTANVTVLPYNPPAATAYQVRRSDAAGAVLDDGQYLRVDLTAAVSSLINGAEKNALTVRAFTRPHGSGAWTGRNVITPAGLTYNTWFLVSGGAAFSPTESYDVRVQVEDKFGAYIADTVVSTAAVAIDLNGTRVGVGKIWEQGAIDVAGDVYSSGEVRHRGAIPVEPVGIVAQFAGATAPSGWLLCNGQAVSRTTYAELFTVLGTTYGAGNGTSTFNVPNLKGRVPVGLDTAQTEFNSLGKTGGAKTHTLTVGQMPSHSHGVGGQLVAGTGTVRRTLTSFPADSDATTESVGGGQAHNNLQPYLTVNHIIKAL